MTSFQQAMKLAEQLEAKKIADKSIIDLSELRGEVGSKGRYYAQADALKSERIEQSVKPKKLDDKWAAYFAARNASK